MTESTISQRIDKWLWHARFVKTRSLAQKLVTGGNVRLDREKVTSASRMIRPGNVLTLSLPGKVVVVEILDIANRRGPYSEACLLYKDLTPITKVVSSGEKPPQTVMEQKEARPNKHKRREAIKLKRNYPGT
ncbi:MAG: RNA-binding S4 domain-containing protein [Pseudomonadota bacterium]